MDNTPISVIFPTLITTQEQLSMTLRSLNELKKSMTLPYELIIVETKTNCLAEYADIYIHEKNITTTNKSINKGFKVASNPYSLFVSNDVFAKIGFDKAMLECFHLFKDCAMSTVASTQFNHVESDKIEEANWFATFMINTKLFKDYGYFDEGYADIWGDTDLLLMAKSDNLCMYRNYKVVVDHLIGQTEYKKVEHKKNWNEGRERFYQKWSNNEKVKELFEKYK